MNNETVDFSLNTFEKLLLFIFGIPKTILFNFHYFPWKIAVKLPVFISNRVWLSELGGSVELGTVRSGIVRIGFGGVGIFDRQNSRTVWQSSGRIKFNGTAKIGHGSKICATGDINFGDNFCISAESALISHKNISFGKNVLISWDVLIMDSDHHDIFDKDGFLLNPPSNVVIGSDVWIGCRSLILKGVTVPDGVVIAANSTVTKSILKTNSIIGGNPVKILKEDINWVN